MTEAARSERMELRLEASEKAAFREAADASGLPLSAWIRERLRRAAISDLQELGRVPKFLKRRKAKDRPNKAAK